MGSYYDTESTINYFKSIYEDKTDNSRNGYSEKTLKSSVGDIEIAVPRDRKRDFEPQIVKKPRPR